MPFAVNDATRFISPTKTPEFLAADLPVVSTPIVDVVRTYGQRGLVQIAEADTMVDALEDALRRPCEDLGKVDAFLSRIVMGFDVADDARLNQTCAGCAPGRCGSPDYV